MIEPKPEPVQPPATRDQIIQEAREACDQFNAAAVRLGRAMAALQASVVVQLAKH